MTDMPIPFLPHKEPQHPTKDDLRHGHFIDCRHCRETIFLAQVVWWNAKKYRAFNPQPDANGCYVRHTCMDDEEK